MKTLSTMIAAVVGLFVGGIGAYLLFIPLYMIYERLYPVTPSEECARGNGLAFLAIMFGAWSFSVFCAVRVACQHDKMVLLEIEPQNMN